MSQVEERLQALGYRVPEAPAPAAVYVPVVEAGGLLFVSGQVPWVEGRVAFTGKVGGPRSLAEGQESARICALNALAVLKQHLGSLDRVGRIVKLTGFVNATADFTLQHLVINGASEVLVTAFGEAGRHARSAVGMASLPLDATTEVELVVSLSC